MSTYTIFLSEYKQFYFLEPVFDASEPPEEYFVEEVDFPSTDEEEKKNLPKKGKTKIKKIIYC